MALSTSELERIADDMYRGRMLTLSTYCGDCGYNLRTLPYIYKCPECGNEYNARPLLMKGIFIPYRDDPPFRDLLGIVGFALATAVIGYGALKPLDIFRLVIALFFMTFTIISAMQFGSKLKHYLRAIQILGRIKREDEA